MYGEFRRMGNYIAIASEEEVSEGMEAYIGQRAHGQYFQEKPL